MTYSHTLILALLAAPLVLASPFPRRGAVNLPPIARDAPFTIVPVPAETIVTTRAGYTIYDAQGTAVSTVAPSIYTQYSVMEASALQSTSTSTTSYEPTTSVSSSVLPTTSSGSMAADTNTSTEPFSVIFSRSSSENTASTSSSTAPSMSSLAPIGSSSSHIHSVEKTSSTSTSPHSDTRTGMEETLASTAQKSASQHRSAASKTTSISATASSSPHRLPVNGHTSRRSQDASFTQSTSLSSTTGPTPSASTTSSFKPFTAFTTHGIHHANLNHTSTHTDDRHTTITLHETSIVRETIFATISASRSHHHHHPPRTSTTRTKTQPVDSIASFNAPSKALSFAKLSITLPSTGPSSSYSAANTVLPALPLSYTPPHAHLHSSHSRTSAPESMATHITTIEPITTIQITLVVPSPPATSIPPPATSEQAVSYYLPAAPPSTTQTVAMHEAEASASASILSRLNDPMFTVVPVHVASMPSILTVAGSTATATVTRVEVKYKYKTRTKTIHEVKTVHETKTVRHTVRETATVTKTERLTETLLPTIVLQ